MKWEETRGKIYSIYKDILVGMGKPAQAGAQSKQNPLFETLTGQ